MANEIKWRHTATGATVYATIRSMAGTMWSTAGTPNFEMLTVANWANYKITLTETPGSSYFYVGTFPAISGNMVAGWYDVDIFSGSAGISDTVIGSMQGYWDGTAFKFWGNDLLQCGGSAVAVGAIPNAAAGAEGGLAVLPSGLKLAVTLDAANISGGPVPAIATYALDCPLGLVVTGPAWAGTFDVAGVHNGRPYFQRQGQYESADYYIAWDGTDKWDVGTTLGGSETGYALASPTPVTAFSKPDATISAPATVSYNEGFVGNHIPPQHVHLAVYAYKTVDGQKIYSAASGSEQYIAGENGVSVEWSWDAVSGADGYVVHATIDAYDVGETHYNQWDYWEDVNNVTYRTFTDAYNPAGNSAIDVSNTTVTYVDAVPAVIAIAADSNVLTVKSIDADAAITARVDASTKLTAVDTLTKAGGDGDLAATKTAVAAITTAITKALRWLRILGRKDAAPAAQLVEFNAADDSWAATGTFVNTTESVEAIAASAASILEDTGTTLPALIDAIPPPIGEGAYTGVLTINDGTTGLEGAIVNAYRAGTLVATGITNSSGQITTWVFDAHTYSLAVRLPGYQPSTGTLTVSGNAWAKSISLTQLSITPPSSPNLCTVQFRVKLSDTPVAGAICKAKLLGINQAADGTILSNDELTDTTDVNGIAEIELVQRGSIIKGNGVYTISVDINGKPAASVQTTIPSQQVVLFEDLL